MERLMCWMPDDPEAAARSPHPTKFDVKSYIFRFKICPESTFAEMEDDIPQHVDTLLVQLEVTAAVRVVLQAAVSEADLLKYYFAVTRDFLKNSEQPGELKDGNEIHFYFTLDSHHKLANERPEKVYKVDRIDPRRPFPLEWSQTDIGLKK